ncbi:hypothetical protein BDR07DRAFT_1453171 [Suillus spraguei]|nr:hypothetical protein BDR07DRAFT_1453171 [Suillus spraguei]
MRIPHNLVSAYGMLKKCTFWHRPKRATPEVMTAFHMDEYIHFLNRVTLETAKELTYLIMVPVDNLAFGGVFDFYSISAGGSICTTMTISSDIVINWAGGLHHAKKREASGFSPLRTHPRFLYINIDSRHGDSVKEVFCITGRVTTCSFHKFGECFPGEDTVDIPLKDEITGEAFKRVFKPAIVLQYGVDSLSGDELGYFNLAINGHPHCVQYLRAFNVPLILLGGGGYTVKNVARIWTYETVYALGIRDDIDPNLPWNEWFGPCYRLKFPENNMDGLSVRNENSDKVRATALQQLS